MSSQPELRQEEMFAPEENRGPLKEYHPQEFSQRHRIAVLLQAAGMRNKEIAETLNFSESRVSVILNDPRAEKVRRHHAAEVADSLHDVRERLKAHAHEALDEVVEEMRLAEDARIRQRAAFGILDRAGFSKIEQRFVATAEVHADAGREIASALRESEAAEDTIDAEYSFVEGESK